MTNETPGNNGLQDFPVSDWKISGDDIALTTIEREGIEPETFEDLVAGIKKVDRAAKRHVANETNRTQLLSYWLNGRMIAVYELNGKDRAEYGDRTIKQLSKRLTRELERGYSTTNLYNMRQFYKEHQIFQSVTGKLTWTHYCELMGVGDSQRRSFYEHEAANSGWSVREMRRQMDSMLFERLLKAKDEARREHVMALANEGVVPRDPADIIREPYVLEFLDLPEDEPPMESDLEAALVAQIEKFMRELGRGFWFVGTQQRVTLGNVHHYVDMVFYNKLLRSFVLIELKTSKLVASAVGQINAYLNYYAEEVNDEFDNPPIGIILCTDKRNIDAHYALGGLENRIFASTYVTVMSDEEELAEQVRMAIEANERKALMSGDEDA